LFLRRQPPGYCAAFLVIGIVLLSLSALGAANPQTPPKWMNQFNDDWELLRAGDSAAALSKFRSLWLANSGQFELAYAIGSALDSTGHHRDATSWYEKALKLNPRFVPAYNNLALNLASQGLFEKAVPLLKKATKLDPANEQAFYNLGLLDLQLHQASDASSAFRQAHKLKPEETDPVVRLAYASLLAGQRSEGMKALDEYVSLSGGTPESVLEAVEILNAVGMYRDALERAHRVLPASGTDRARLTYDEALSLFHLQQYKQASETLSHLSPSVRSKPSVSLLLGSCQALSGNLPEAVNTFQSAVRVAPGQPEPYYRLALALMQGSRNQDAEQVLLTGLRRIPDSPLLLYTLAMLNESETKYKDAIKYAQRSIQFAPRQPAAWMLLGDLEMRLGEYQQALHAYQTSLHYAFVAEDAIRYADLLSSLREFSQAKHVLESLLQKQPTYVEAYVEFGKLYFMQKEYAQAVPFLHKALRLDPNNSDAHLFLGQILYRLGKPDEAKQEIALAAKEKKQSEPARLLRKVLVPVTQGSLTNGGSQSAHR